MQSTFYTASNSHYFPSPWKSPEPNFTVRKSIHYKPQNRFKILTFTNALRIPLGYEPEEGVEQVSGPRPEPASSGRLPVVIRKPGRVSRYYWDGNRLQLVRVDGGASSFSFDFDDGFRKMFRLCGSAFRDFFIPKQVSGNYMDYVKWKFLHRVFSSALQVLATQAMLRAIGIGYSRSLPSAAALNWVLGFSLPREMRKIVTIELLSNHRLDMLKHIRTLEVKAAIRELFKLWENDSLELVVIGEGEVHSFEKLMRDFYLFGVFVLSDTIPFLGWLDANGYEKAMKKTAKELDTMMGRLLEEHKQKKLLGGAENGEQDFMDVMLTILEDAGIASFDADTINKSTCLNLIIAGSDATMILLTWTLSLLLNNEHVLRKAQEELNIHVGKDRHVDESDVINLVYLQAIVKETLRLYPPAPIIRFRAAMEDCTLSTGYQIPAGTRLMVNAWKIHQGKSIWSERFLTSHKDIDVRGHNFELIPFGSGRRSCPGSSLVLQLVHLTLAPRLKSELYG
ncbi:Cytochrome P450 82A3 [Fagus crenata]